MIANSGPVGASFAEAGTEVNAVKVVTLQTELSHTEFALRNLDSAKLIKESGVAQLSDAQHFENSARNALKSSDHPIDIQASQYINEAIVSGDNGLEQLEFSLQAIDDAISLLEGILYIRN